MTPRKMFSAFCNTLSSSAGCRVFSKHSTPYQWRSTCNTHMCPLGRCVTMWEGAQSLYCILQGLSYFCLYVNCTNFQLLLFPLDSVVFLFKLLLHQKGCLQPDLAVFTRNTIMKPFCVGGGCMLSVWLIWWTGLPLNGLEKNLKDDLSSACS